MFYEGLCFPFGTSRYFLIRFQYLLIKSIFLKFDPKCLLWQDKISVVARQDVCRGKTRSLLWRDKISLVPRHKGGGASRRLHKGARCFPPRHFVDSFISWHKRDLVLPQQRLCFARNAHLVLPQRRSCLATTDIVSFQSRLHTTLIDLRNRPLILI